MGASNVQNFGGLINYSTDEAVVGTWIDGKPVYQKVITGINVTPAYNSWTTICNVPENIETFISYDIHSSNNMLITGSGFEIQVAGTTLIAEYNVNVNRRAFNRIILRYTKTTD